MVCAEKRWYLGERYDHFKEETRWTSQVSFVACVCESSEAQSSNSCALMVTCLPHRLQRRRIVPTHFRNTMLYTSAWVLSLLPLNKTGLLHMRTRCIL